MEGLKFDKITIESETNRYNADFIVEILRKRIIELEQQVEDLTLGNLAPLNVPTTDPFINGVVWLDNGVLKASTPA